MAMVMDGLRKIVSAALGTFLAAQEGRVEKENGRRSAWDLPAVNELFFSS